MYVVEHTMYTDIICDNIDNNIEEWQEMGF